jgi:hypothetical protein
MAVKTIQPAAGTTCVAQNTTIQITFTSSANPNTINSNNIQVTDSSNNAVAGTLTYDSTSDTATFTPNSPLASNMTYTISVKGVTSMSGAVISPFTSTFTTGPCTTQAQYTVSLFNSINENAIYGQISVDSTGTVTATVKGATPTTTYALGFCPAPSQMYSCISVGNVVTDASGNANTTIAFPQPGSWAGDFQLSLNGTAQYQTDVVPNMSSAVYTASLQPASTANGKGIFLNGNPGPQDPLSSGGVSLSNGNVIQVQLTGAAPNVAYSTGECPTYFGSDCYALYNSQGQGSFNTNSSGDVSYSVLQDNVPGDIFTVSQQTGHAGFVSGFNVP